MGKSVKKTAQIAAEATIFPPDFHEKILTWYDVHGRKDLPWQVDDAYFVWISEIMLQQTQVQKVLAYFSAFTARFPTLTDVAKADVSEVLQYWSGLGYYSRARNIHKTAVYCQAHYQGNLPQDMNALMALSGIGRTTAGAIMSLAFNQPCPILDGNVKRVISRVFAIRHEKIAQTDKRLWVRVTELMPEKRAKNYNQALMDLGSLVCKRSKPLCEQCPLQTHCIANNTQTVHLYPQKKAKTTQKKRDLYALYYERDGALLLQQRPAKGIWADLWFLPLFATHEALGRLVDNAVKNAVEKAAADVGASVVGKDDFKLTHILSHQILTIHVRVVRHAQHDTASTTSSPILDDKSRLEKPQQPTQWTSLNTLDTCPHPSALIKIIHQAQA